MDTQISLKTGLFVFTIAIGFSSIVLQLVKRRKLRKEYAIIFLFIALGFVFFTIFPQLFILLATFLDFLSPINLMVFISILLLVLISLYFALKLTMLHNRLKNVTQELVLLRSAIKYEERSNK